MQVVIGANGESRDNLGQWAASRIRGYTLPKEYVALGVTMPAGQGVVIYSDFHAAVPELKMDCAGAGAWLSREALRVFFAYPFIELDCRRVTTIVAKKHKRARKFNERLGFIQEGVCRKAAPGGKDNAIIYGMLKEECRWIGLNHGDS